MTITHNLGLPRIGAKRELKFALEQYWQGAIDVTALQNVGQSIRHENWQRQISANMNFLSVGDFSWYDHVLDLTAMLGVIPDRYEAKNPTLDTYFRMARGRAPVGADTTACEMTKWFDTNYHYIVPEFSSQQTFKVSFEKIFDEINEAKAFGRTVKPILLGPLSYLWLGKTKEKFDKLELLPQLQETYLEILERFSQLGVTWVQIDEPILVLDLPSSWKKAFIETYRRLQLYHLKLLLTTYFGSLHDNLELACQLPVAGLHVDVIRGDYNWQQVSELLPSHKVLSVGIVDGRNIWRTDLRKVLSILKPLKAQFSDNLWIGSSCSLLHCPVDLTHETMIDHELKQTLAFAAQKLTEISVLAKGLDEGEDAIQTFIKESELAIELRKHSKRIHNEVVKKRCRDISPTMMSRNAIFAKRKVEQKKLALPLLPTTTIGSFPQTAEIRKVRQQYKNGQLSESDYCNNMQSQIAYAIAKQTELDLDVFVHGEAERNDMVEYFGELLNGFAFTQNGWVQSYGSRCVKPPIIYGDVSRPKPMTVDWLRYAQSLTSRPVKGMLTGPITILCWSFVRDDQPRHETAKQIALALRDEVDDLVKAGIQVIQIDEPAVREGLPLRQKDWQTYLQQAVMSFRLTASVAPNHIQIHTHMCYSEFNDIIEAIAELDADVITIETSRSNMELLQAFEGFNYPNDIGPGVYDIHSPRIPTIEEITTLLENAAHYIPMERLWVNPDCGLKTRSWQETQLALANMVQAAKNMRKKYQQNNFHVNTKVS